MRGLYGASQQSQRNIPYQSIEPSIHRHQLGCSTLLRWSSTIAECIASQRKCPTVILCLLGVCVCICVMGKRKAHRCHTFDIVVYLRSISFCWRTNPAFYGQDHYRIYNAREMARERFSTRSS